MNKVGGAIDSCHVRIKPPSYHRLDYLNYKGFYSINMQAICDSAGKFLDAFVGYVYLDNGDVLKPDTDVALGPGPPLQGVPEAREMPGNATRDRLAAQIDT